MEMYSVFPNRGLSDIPTDVYNATFSIHNLVENTDFVCIFDNSSMYNISHKLTRKVSPSLSDLNALIASQMSDVTCGIRFPTSIGSNMRKIAMNLCPFPRLHFYAASYAPLREFGSYCKIPAMPADEMISSLFNGNNMLCDVDIKDGRHLTAFASFRGNITEYEIESNLELLHSKEASQYVEWIPNNIAYAK